MTDSPFEKHDYEPEDLLGHVFFAHKEAEDGQPQLVWDVQTEDVHPSLRLELAEHFDQFADSLRTTYWEWVQDETESEAGLSPQEDSAYE